MTVIEAKRYTCQCGGVVLIDEQQKRTLHSVPVCAEYLAIMRSVDAKLEGVGIELPSPTENEVQ